MPGYPPLFPWLKIDAEVQAGLGIFLESVESPSMRLVQLTLNYLSNQPDRIRIVPRETWCLARQRLQLARVRRGLRVQDYRQRGSTKN